ADRLAQFAQGRDPDVALDRFLELALESPADVAAAAAGPRVGRVLPRELAETFALLDAFPQRLRELHRVLDALGVGAVVGDENVPRADPRDAGLRPRRGHQHHQTAHGDQDNRNPPNPG